MTLVVDTFIDGKHQTTEPTPGIRFAVESLLRADKALVVNEVHRGRYAGESRFHVYLWQFQTRTSTTLVFRYAAT